MKNAEEQFSEIALALPEAKRSSMFGAQCYKAPNGKAVVMLWKGSLIVKPHPDEVEEVFKLRGAVPFAPMEGRVMNGWILVPHQHATLWIDLARTSYDYVASLSSNTTKKAAKSSATSKTKTSPRAKVAKKLSSPSKRSAKS